MDFVNVVPVIVACAFYAFTMIFTDLSHDARASWERSLHSHWPCYSLGRERHVLRLTLNQWICVWIVTAGIGYATFRLLFRR